MATSQMHMLQPLPLPFSRGSSFSSSHNPTLVVFFRHHPNGRRLFASLTSSSAPNRRRLLVLANGGKDTASTSTSLSQEDEANPQDLEYVHQIKKVLELFRKNIDMLFSEVKLTFMIEDLREVERMQEIAWH